MYRGENNRTSSPLLGSPSYMEKYLSIHSFSFYGPRILEREHWRQSKIIGIKRFKLLSKDNNSQFA